MCVHDMLLVYLGRTLLLLLHFSLLYNADVHLRLQKLSEQIALHETEKQQMREEFDLQRAKMKELYLQKEGGFEKWLLLFAIYCSL